MCKTTRATNLSISESLNNIGSTILQNNMNSSSVNVPVCEHIGKCFSQTSSCVTSMKILAMQNCTLSLELSLIQCAVRLTKASVVFSDVHESLVKVILWALSILCWTLFVILSYIVLINFLRKYLLEGNLYLGSKMDVDFLKPRSLMMD